MELAEQGSLGFGELPETFKIGFIERSLEYGHLSQDFPCPITLEKQEAYDWTGKREAEQRVTETGSVSGEREGRPRRRWTSISVALTSHRYL